MARTYARILTRIWQDDQFLALSVGAQRLYMLALSQPTLSLLGVTPWTPKRWSRLSSSTSPETVENDVAELQAAGFVEVDDDTEELWIRTFVRYDDVLKSPNLIKGATNDYNKVLSASLRNGIIEWFRAEFLDGFTNWLVETFPTFEDNGFKGLNERFMKDLGEPLPEGFRTTVNRHPSTSSVSVNRQPVADTVDDELADGGETDDDVRLDEYQTTDGDLLLAHRISDICHHHDKSRVHDEALSAMHWIAREHIPQYIVNDALSWAKSAPQPPLLPQAVMRVVQQKAIDAGLTPLPFYVPPSTRTA